MNTLKTILASLLIILIIHFFLKNILLHNELNKDIENFEKYNIANTKINCTNDNLSNMKDDLLDFINDNSKIYENDYNNMSLSDNMQSFDNLYNHNSNADFKSNLTNLDSFFEKKTICESNNSNELEKIDKCNNDAWQYENENIMNGGEISSGLHGFAQTENLWAECDNKQDLKCI